MLTMTLATHTVKIMALYNTLETFPLGRSNHINDFTFRENVNSQSIPQIFLYRKIAEFSYKLFCCGI